MFAQAKCASCHQHGDFGESMGPNLSTVGKRFLKHEILESIVDPSKVISDQYKAKTLITDEGKSYTGIVGSGGQGELTVLQADGTKVRIPADTIEQTVPSKVSARPAGLIDSLSAQQVADLINFLENTPAIQVSEAEKDTLQR